MADGLLDDLQLFGSLPPGTRRELERSATTRRYARNEVLFRQGEAASELYGILAGRVAVCTQISDGRESVVAVLESGSLFGEFPLFDGGPRSTDVRALEETRVVVLQYDDVHAALQENPDVLWDIVRRLVGRLRAADDALADAVFLDVPGRTAKRLLDLAGDVDRFRLPMTQEELAGLVGASRERVNKAISLFAKLGWLEVEGRGRYHILDRVALEERSTT
jgi:CRP-like cAMP-binding protein